MAQRKHILVVDDEPQNQRLYKDFLDGLGHSSESANDGLEALEKLESGFDLVLLDIMMPGMDGFEVVRRIRNNLEFADIPILIATVLDDKETRIRAVQAGANDFLSKPIDGLEFRVRIESLLKMKDTQDTVRHRREELEAIVAERTAELRESNERLRVELAERKRVEESLRDSEQFLRQSEKIARIGGWKANPFTNSLYWSEGVYDIVEAPKDYQPGLGEGLEFYSPPYRPILTEALAKTMEQEEPFRVEAEVITTSGKHLWTEVRGLMRVEEGQEPQVVGSLMDITERKLAEEALREGEQTLNSILSASPIGIALIEGRTVKWVNQACVEMFGYENDIEMVSKSTSTFYSSQEDYKLSGRTFYEEAESLAVVHRKTRFRKKDGSFFDAEVRLRLVDPNTSGGLTIVIVNDITDQQKADREREGLQLQLVRAQKMEAIGTLAGGIAHDFNNLLQVIAGYSELMITNPSLPEQFGRGIKSINKAALSGADLVRRLLTVSRKAETRPAPLNLNDKIKQISELLDRTIPKMIRIELKLSENRTLISADASQIEQIIMNLAVNASHAMPEGGNLVIETEIVTIDDAYCSLHVESSPGRYVLLSVSDTGHGMDKKTMDRIFEPFFTTKGPGIGTGLGLAMVYGIVKQHGGHTTCDSEPGAGTTFKIYFPAIGSELKLEKPVNLLGQRGGTETILLVDDDERVREVETEILLEYGYHVITASNGKEAVKIYSTDRERISLVILDLSMPEMGGIECLRALLSMDSKVKVLVTTGYAKNGLAEDLKEAGATDFIEKPSDIPQLLGKIRKIIDEE